MQADGRALIIGAVVRRNKRDIDAAWETVKKEQASFVIPPLWSAPALLASQVKKEHDRFKRRRSCRSSRGGGGGALVISWLLAAAAASYDVISMLFVEMGK
ncbi:uncharacterized protein A4U43_C07F25440 [Asparagus officinalis]|uniref:Uncharacterized protein n=1 Tax=Asparagus officinalis TaxID=4686 RepID=A0A5P1EES8_ASPOF|nr:uncharacterized protein A4U43_C07F25440 [Asparagus officinalis]